MKLAAIQLLLLLLLGYFIYWLSTKSDTSGLKFILLGLSIILTGGIVAVDRGFSLGGFEYIIVFAGLIISVIGFGKNN